MPAPREGWTFGYIAPLCRMARYFPLDRPENGVMHGAVLTVAQACPDRVAALAAD